MTKPLLIIHGAGRHGEVVAGIALDLGWEVKITDDSEGTSPLPGQDCIIGIGDNRARKQYDNKWLTSIIHPSVQQSASARIGPGCFIAAGVIINACAVVGRGSIINTGAIVEHDCVVGAWSHLSPGVVLCGTVKLGEGVWIGANATVRNNITISPWTVVGCGANVVKDITEPGIYVGNPVRKLE